MKHWQSIPEIVGCNAALRMAIVQAVDAVEQGLHVVIEGEAGSGRRLLARSAWSRRAPGARSLFTVDCRMFRSDGAEELLFGEHGESGGTSTLQLGRLNLTPGGGLLLLRAECLPVKVQLRLAEAIASQISTPRSERIQILMTSTLSITQPQSLHPKLSALLATVRVPALRERVEDIRAIAEVFLRNAAPFENIRCSQALIDKFCGYDWPANVSELRSVLRRLLLLPHGGLLDVRHVADLMYRDDTCLALLQGSPYSAPFATGDYEPHATPDGWRAQ